jgi:hypothetical protein
MWGKKERTCSSYAPHHEPRLSRFSALQSDITILSLQPVQDKPNRCPDCGGIIHRHGTRRRIAMTQGADRWVCVWRFRCADRGKTFTRLPPFLLPFKRYVVKEIEGVMRHLCDGGQLSQAPSAAEESTLHRWWKEYSA